MYCLREKNHVLQKITVFWNVTQCSLAGGYECFGATCCFCLHDR